MKLFPKKIICKKFFTYKTNTIDISGLSTGLSNEQLAGFNINVGQFKLKPEYVEASEKLQELDLMQYSICQTIKNISDNMKRDELLVRLAEIKMQMLSIVQNPDKAPENEIHNSNLKFKKIVTIQAKNSEIKELLMDNNTVGDALNLLREILPSENIVIMFLSEYNQLTDEIQKGIKSYSNPEWRSLINRIMLFVDSKIT